MPCHVDSPALEVIRGLFRNNLPSQLQQKLSGLTSLQLVDDETYLDLQDWCSSNSNIEWATGISLLEAVDEIVRSAIENGNIVVDDEPLKDEKGSPDRA